MQDHAEPFTGLTLHEGPRSLAQDEELGLHTMLLDAISHGVLAHTLDGRIIYVNEAACSLYGYCRRDFENLSPWGWVPEHARHLVPDRLAELRSTGSAVFSGVGPPLPDGSPMQTEIHSRICATANHGEIAISVAHDITDRMRAEEKIRHMAFHDMLTGLPNRELLKERIQQARASSERHGDIVGIVYIDLDDFKPVNDTLGHSTGDEVLRIVADRLVRCTRDSDTVARLGGDEFVALFPRLDSADDLATIASSLAGCVDVPIQIKGHRISVTASVGLALYLPAESTDELIIRADHAMYRAKRDGLSGWEEYLAEQRAAGR